MTSARESGEMGFGRDNVAVFFCWIKICLHSHWHCDLVPVSLLTGSANGRNRKEKGNLLTNTCSMALGSMHVDHSHTVLERDGSWCKKDIQTVVLDTSKPVRRREPRRKTVFACSGSELVYSLPKKKTECIFWVAQKTFSHNISVLFGVNLGMACGACSDWHVLKKNNWPAGSVGNFALAKGLLFLELQHPPCRTAEISPERKKIKSRPNLKEKIALFLRRQCCAFQSLHFFLEPLHFIFQLFLLHFSDFFSFLELSFFLQKKYISHEVIKLMSRCI